MNHTALKTIAKGKAKDATRVRAIGVTTGQAR